LPSKRCGKDEKNWSSELPTEDEFYVVMVTRRRYQFINKPRNSTVPEKIHNADFKAESLF